MKILLLGASFGTRNMGVNALASGTAASVFHSLPDARLAFFDYAKECSDCRVRFTTGDRQVPLKHIRFSKKIGLPNNIARLILAAIIHRMLPHGALARRIREHHPRLSDILEADVVVALSGGDSFSDIYGMSRLFYVCLPQVLVLAANRPLVLLPQTVGPFATRLGRFVARFILHRAHRTYCRDSRSLGEVSVLLGREVNRAALAFDMGFALEPLAPKPAVITQLQRLRAKGPLIGLNVSGLLYAGGYTGRNEFGLTNDYKNLVGRLLATLMAIEGVDVLLVPHVLGGPQSNESDLTASANIYREYAPAYGDRLHNLTVDCDHHELKYAIGQCDFFLGSRMHACIAALSQCVPAVGLAYSRKFAGVFETIGCGELVIDLTAKANDEVIAEVSRLYAARQQLHDRLQSRMPQVRRDVLDLFVKIANSLPRTEAP